MKPKKITAIISLLLVAVFQVNASAAVLGEIIDGYISSITEETEFYHYTYQSGRSLQSEHYVEYKPNSEVVPVLVNGSAIYGKRTLTEAMKYMQNNGLKPIMGMNADFFSVQTGIPLGHTIIDGELVTSDPAGQNAIGFRADGTAFMSWLEIQSKFIKYDGTEMMLDCVNKWCQPTISASYLLTDKFGDTTQTSGDCKFIIFSPIDGKLALGKSIWLKVEEKFDYDGNIAIPDGKLVLVMTNTYGDRAKLQFMDSFNVGDEVELKTETVYDKEAWSSAQCGLGTVGGRLIENGKVYTQFEAGVAPRTAVGIRADGTVVFYTIDGRQPSWSIGITIKTLAERMYELGCVDAVNLDGGGSTAIGGVFDGNDQFVIANSPSEGSLRKCANFLFLKDMRMYVAPEYSFKINVPENRKYLSGFVETINITDIVDADGNPADRSVISYRVDNPDGSNISIDNGVVTVAGSGVGHVTVKTNGMKQHINYTVYKTPQTISAFADGAQIKELTFLKNDNAIVDIDAKAFMNNEEIHSDDGCYKWSCDTKIGYIDRNGMFVPNTSEIISGNIYISAGSRKLTIPVKIEAISVFSDMDFHWAKEYANDLYHSGIVTGEDIFGNLIFRPESNITRGEFAVMVSRYMNLDINKYPKYKFKDYDKIPDWQKPYANAVAAEGIITGKDTGWGVTFSGEDSITRAEAMTILYRTTNQNYNFADVAFKDSYKIPDYAQEAVNVLVGLGIVNGYNDGRLNPVGTVTRAETVKMISGCIDKF